MENLAGVGVSSTALQYLEQDKLKEITEDPEEEVPFVAAYRNIEKEPGKAPTREPVYDTLPREEWERRESTLDVRDKVNEILEEEYPNQPVYVSFQGDNQSPTGFSVGVEVENDERLDFSLEEIEDTLPTQAEGYTPESNPISRQGIPIVVGEIDREDFNYEFRDYNPVPGGQRIISYADTDNGYPLGTLTGAFHSNEHGDGLVSAGHVLNQNDVYVNEIISDSDSSDEDSLGQSRDVQNSNWLDIGFIEMTFDQSPKSWITSPDNSDIDLNISGIYTDNGLNYYADGNPIDISMQGKESGRKSGEIKKTHGSPTQAVTVGTLMDEGDSGGPMFTNRSDNDLITLAGLIDGGYTPYGYTSPQWTWGTTAETMEDELGGFFY